MGESSHSILSSGRKPRIVIIGTGNVSWHLTPAIAQLYDVTAIYSRSVESAVELAKKLHTKNVIAEAITPDTNLAEADIYIISVKDSAITDVVKTLVPKSPACSLWLHTSGSVPMTVFDGYIKNFGVLYPLQTFSKGAELDFSEVPLLIEASCDEAHSVLSKFARTISKNVHDATSEIRRKIHIAAVFACNFANAMWDIADKQLQRESIPFSVLLPLLQNSLAKLSTMTPNAAQTGPAVRGDIKLMESHIASLEGDEREIYSLISKYIINQHK